MGAREAVNGAFGVGAFGDVFHEGDFDALAEPVFNGAAAEVVLEGPAGFADGRDINKADAQIGGGNGRGEGESREGGDDAG